jgi:hypothetical protein
MTLDLRRACRRQIPFYRTGKVSRSPFRDRLWAVPRYNPNIADQPSLQLKEREELRKDSWLAGDPDELVDALFRQGIYREVERWLPQIIGSSTTYLRIPRFSISTVTDW